MMSLPQQSVHRWYVFPDCLKKYVLRMQLNMLRISNFSSTWRCVAPFMYCQATWTAASQPPFVSKPSWVGPKWYLRLWDMDFCLTFVARRRVVGCSQQLYVWYLLRLCLRRRGSCDRRYPSYVHVHYLTRSDDLSVLKCLGHADSMS